jgi:hypothetical protein
MQDEDLPDFEDRPHPAVSATVIEQPGPAGQDWYAVLNLVGLLAIAAYILLIGGAK